MADKRITDLPLIFSGDVTSTDVLPIVDVNLDITNKIEVDQLKSYILTGVNDYYVTGGTYSNGTITLNRQNGSITINGLYTGSTDVFVTGGTYDNNTGTLTLEDNNGTSFGVTGFTTGGTGTSLYEVGSGTDSTQRVGVNNIAIGNCSAVLAGSGNTVISDFSFIGGGYNNTAGFSGGVNSVYNETFTGNIPSSGFYGSIPPSSTLSGLGSGSTFSFYFSTQTTLSNVYVDNQGSGYVSGDTLTFNGSNFGGVDITDNVTVQVNTVGGSNIVIGGGQGNTANRNSSTISGGILNKSNANCSTIGGGCCNIISKDSCYSTISGGRRNTGYGCYGTVSGGRCNEAGAYGTITGTYNQVYTGGTLNGTFSGGYGPTSTTSVYGDDALFGFVFNSGTLSSVKIVNGGNLYSGNDTLFFNGNLFPGGTTGVDDVTFQVNTSINNYATVGGGRCNTASGEYSTISGGACNTINTNSQYSTIGGGDDNTILQGDVATISGGENNTISGDYSFIGGGYDNKITSSCATISGGFNNTASGYNSFIGGGENNVSGRNNFVSGINSSVYTGSTLNNTYGGISPTSTSSGTGSGALFSFDFVLGVLQGIQIQNGGSGYSNGETLYFNGGLFGGGSSPLDDVWLNIQTNNSTHTTVSGGYCNTSSGDYSTVSGGYRNTSSCYSSTVSGGINNTSSGNSSTVGGGLENTSSCCYSTVSGGRRNTSSGYHSTVSGGYNNTSSNCYSTISGGINNINYGDQSFIGGGCCNIVDLTGDSLLGGVLNQITSSPVPLPPVPVPSNGHRTIGGGFANLALGTFSVIGGGQQNTASGCYGSTVSGGGRNTSSGYYSTVSGGANNTSSGYYSTVSGGYCNTSSNCWSTVSGGRNNLSENQYDTIGGGLSNTTILSGGATGGATISGGECNTSGNYYTFNGGGCRNVILGEFSTIGGGQNNQNISGLVQQVSFNSGNASAIPDNTYSIYPTTILGYGSGLQISFDVSGGSVSNVNVVNPGIRYEQGEQVLVSGDTIGGSSPANDLTFDLDNVVTSEFSFIGGGQSNTLVGQNSVVVGGILNTVIANTSSIGGGVQNTVNENFSTINGGFNNTTSADGSFIGGGTENKINSTSALSIIGAGRCNTVSSIYGVIVGGSNNDITQTGGRSNIGGGFQNTIQSEVSNINGGRCNTLGGINPISTVSVYGSYNGNPISDGSYLVTPTSTSGSGSGGQLNISFSGYYVSGTFVNFGGVNYQVNDTITFDGGLFSGGTSGVNDITFNIDSIDSAIGNCSTISGGFCNTLLGNYSSIGGGVNNTISAYNATIGGGQGNTAFGYQSFIGGGFCNTTIGTRSAVVGGQSIIATENDMTYMPSANIQSTGYLYFGDDVDGSWRMSISGATFIIEKRVGGVWVVSGTFV
jgi:hypothetical protein